MMCSPPRAFARRLRPWLGALLLAMTPAAFAAADIPLGLDEVQRLALDAQPQLLAQAAAVRAREERSIAAGQLPDPQLSAGIQDLPVNTDAAYSLRRDDFTMLKLGLMQEFPRAGKRALRSERERLQADVARDQLDELRRRIRRDAALAWLDLYLPERAGALLESMLAEAQRSRDATEIAYRAGRAEQAELLASSVALALLQDKAAEYRQMAAHGRRMLTRWIGAAAERPLDTALPELPEPPPLPELLATLPAHPALRVPERERAVARTGLALARQATKPDWRVELDYGYRPEFAELVSLKVGIDLPLFAAHRQDHETAAASAELEQADARREDTLRALTAEAGYLHHDWLLLRERLQRFDQTVLPPATARVDAALASYGAGRGTLATLIEARRMLLDVQLQRLTIAVDAERFRLGLQYFLQDSP